MNIIYRTAKESDAEQIVAFYNYVVAKPII